MTKYRYYVIAIFFAAMTSPIISITLDDLYKLSIKNNHDYKAMVLAEKRDLKKLDAQSFLTKDPVFAFSYANIPLSSWPDRTAHAMSGLQYSISQELSISPESSYRKERYRQLHLSTKSKRKLFEKELERDVTIWWHRLLWQRKKEDILNDSYTALEKILNIARQKVAVNQMNSTLLLKIEADKKLLKNRLLETQTDITEVVNNLSRLCVCDVKLSDVPDTAWFIDADNINIPGQIEFTKHPLREGLLHQQLAARNMVNQSKYDLIPKLTLTAAYTQREEIRGRDTGEDFITLKASMPLPLWYTFRQSNSIAAEENQEQAIDRRLSALDVQLKTTADTEMKRAQSLLNSYRHYQNQVVPGYYTAYSGELAALTYSKTTLISALDAYRLYLEVSLGQAETFFKLQKSLASIHFLQGREHESAGVKND